MPFRRFFPFPISSSPELIRESETAARVDERGLGGHCSRGSCANSLYSPEDTLANRHDISLPEPLLSKCPSNRQTFESFFVLGTSWEIKSGRTSKSRARAKSSSPSKVATSTHSPVVPSLERIDPANAVRGDSGGGSGEGGG